MAVSQDSFPARKRRPSAGAFISPNISDQKLIQLLFHLSQEISSLQPTTILLKKTSASVIRKSKLISILFEELVRFNPVDKFPASATLCFEELYIVLQRIKVLLEDCHSCSKTWLLTQIPTISSSFHQLIGELSTLLDIFPAKEMSYLSEDVIEFFDLIKKQCTATDCTDATDEKLRNEVLKMLDDIKREIVPDQRKLSEIFEKLGLNDSRSCTDEIENLEDEVRSQNDDESRANAVALIGLVRYAKCVLYGASSTPRVQSANNKHPHRTTSSEANVPSDLRCPISLELMRDPVVVATGQTYDRSSITLWIESGHNTCPKTGQNLAHTEMIPNLALKNLIAMWCRDHRIPFESTELTDVRTKHPVLNKTALEAVKMTVTFLITKLASFASSSSSSASDDVDRVVYELRVLAKTDSDSRSYIGEAGALPLLVNFLGSENPSLQVNSVTTILNLSILEANKKRIMETEGVLNGVIEVLKSGATWEAKGNAAAAIFSLTGVHAYRKRLGRKTRVVASLVELARSGTTSAKRDAMMAILNLAGDREAVGKLIEGGVIGLAETKQVSTILSANEAPPSESGAPRDVPQGENEDMEDAADPNLVKGEGKAKEEAKPTHVSPGTYDSFVNLETVSKHGSANASFPTQSEPVTPSSFSISTLMAEDGDGTPEDQAAFMKELESYYRYRAMDFKPPKFYGQPLNCLKLWRAVIRLGGYDRVTGAKLWRQVGESFRPPKTCTTVSWTFRNFYEKSLLEYERHKIRCGELQFGTETLPETPGVDVEGNGFQGSVSGRARRDAAARAMQGWHSQRHFGYGEVAEPVIKDKNVINNAKREKNLKGIGAVSVLGKQKRPNEVEHSVKAIRTETSRQLVTSVIDIGPPAEWVKVNVLQAKDCFEVYALVPGLLREEVRVQSDPAGRLVITGQPEQVDNPWGVTAFKKVISLPTRIDPLRTSAVVSLHGGLFVHVPFEQSDS